MCFFRYRFPKLCFITVRVDEIINPRSVLYFFLSFSEVKAPSVFFYAYQQVCHVNLFFLSVWAETPSVFFLQEHFQMYLCLRSSFIFFQPTTSDFLSFFCGIKLSSRCLLCCLHFSQWTRTLQTLTIFKNCLQFMTDDVSKYQKCLCIIIPIIIMLQYWCV